METNYTEMLTYLVHKGMNADSSLLRSGDFDSST